MGLSWPYGKEFKALDRARTSAFHHILPLSEEKVIDSASARDLVVEIPGEVRSRYGFALVGYVIMPEHVHMLISETGRVLPAKVIQAFKQRVSRKVRGKKRRSKKQMAFAFAQRDGELQRFWQRRYYDFNVYSRGKLREKLDYMHANPVKEKLVSHPRDWPWSSWSFYFTEKGMLGIDPWK